MKKKIYMTKSQFKKIVPKDKKAFLIGVDSYKVKPYLRLLESINVNIAGFIVDNDLLDGFSHMGYEIYSLEHFKNSFSDQYEDYFIVDTSRIWKYRINKGILKRNGIKSEYIGYEITSTERKSLFIKWLLGLVDGLDAPINRWVINRRKDKDPGIEHRIYHQQIAAVSCLFHEYLALGQYENDARCENDMIYIFKLFFEKIKVLFYGGVSLHSCVIPPGTRCTLKCKNCNQMYPYFLFSKECEDIRGDFDPEVIWSDISKLLSAVDHIGVLHLVGGEPLINKSLPFLLEKIVNEPRIRCLLIITNGTVMPSEDVLKYLKHKKVMVRLSEYPEEITKNRSKVIKCFNDNKINLSVNYRDEWDKPLDFEKTKSKQQIFEMTKTCYAMSHCVDMFQGKIFPCERMAAANAMHFIPDEKDDYIDVRELTSKELRKSISSFFSKTYFPCCERCNIGEKIPPAEQLKHGEELHYPVLW